MTNFNTENNDINICNKCSKLCYNKCGIELRGLLTTKNLGLYYIHKSLNN